MRLKSTDRMIWKKDQPRLKKIKKCGPLLAALILLTVPLWGCRMKIAGDEYIVGPIPTSNDQDRGARDRNLQEPASREKGEGRKDRPAEEDQK